jgi:hypothetical protein
MGHDDLARRSCGGGGARRFGRGMNGRGDLGERRSTPRKQSWEHGL